MSADTIVPGYANPQNLNRYSYVGNSPLNYTDPSGHVRIQEGQQNDQFSSSLADQYVPIRRPNEDEIVLPPTVTPTPTNTPTVTPTQCPQVAIGCDPSATGTPAPMATPTPYTGPTIGAGPSSTYSHNWANTFTNLREYFGLIDMFEPGALTGTNISPVSAYVQSVQQYVALNPGLIYNEWLRPTIPIALAAPVVATGYDYTYDQVTNSGPYSTLPPRVIESPGQAIHFVVSVIIITSLIPYIPPPP